MKPRPFVLQCGAASNTARRTLVDGSSCGEIISAGCREFKIPKKDAQLVLEDGTEIDDEYLEHCYPYTVLVLLRSKEKIEYVPNKVREMILNIQKLLSASYEEVNHSLNDTEKDTLVNMLHETAESITTPPELILLDSREEHPGWFEGHPSAKSKREVMNENSKRRIKGYYYKSKDELRKSSTEACFPTVEYLFKELWEKLQEDNFNGHFFVRGHKHALCNSNGQFNCEGPYNLKSCSKMHRINPYTSHHHLVLFGTWNLDHRIERSRSILPAIREASESSSGRRINSDYFYSLLFTRQNLKLVHLVCHKKEKHSGYECSKKLWFNGRVELGKKASQRNFTKTCSDGKIKMSSKQSRRRRTVVR